MARPTIGARPLTNAERQAAYRTRKKAAGLKRKEDWINPFLEEKGGMSDEQEKIKKRWQEEELKSARKAGRGKEQRKYYRRGYVAALVSVSGFFISKGRPDIAGSLLSQYNIDQAECKENQVNSLEMTALDKAGIFDKPDEKTK